MNKYNRYYFLGIGGIGMSASIDIISSVLEA